MLQIEWRSQAQDDLDEILPYVFEFQPAAAWRLRDAIMRQVELSRAWSSTIRFARLVKVRDGSGLRSCRARLRG